jgi:hypothetical protein
MTIKYLSGNRISGLEADTKPTSIPTDSEFFETDTDKTYTFNGSSWVEIGGADDGFYISQTLGTTVKTSTTKEYIIRELDISGSGTLTINTGGGIEII